MRALTGFLLLTILAGEARALEQSYGWSGPVVSSSIDGVVPEDPATLTVLLNPVTADLDPSPSRGVYDVGANGFVTAVVEIGPLDLREVACSGGEIVVALDDPVQGDVLSINGEDCRDEGLELVAFAGAVATDPSAQAFDSDALPADPEPWMFSEAHITLDLGGARGSMEASVTEMLEVPGPAAAPGALAALLALGVVGRCRTDRAGALDP